MNGLSVRAAAEKLNTSESTVRRLLPTTLRVLPGPGRVRITPESVEAERVARILALGGYPTPVCSPAHERLEADNRVLKQVIQDLLVSSSALADAVRGLTQPDVPND